MIIDCMSCKVICQQQLRTDFTNHFWWNERSYVEMAADGERLPGPVPVGRGVPMMCVKRPPDHWLWWRERTHGDMIGFLAAERAARGVLICGVRLCFMSSSFNFCLVFQRSSNTNIQHTLWPSRWYTAIYLWAIGQYISSASFWELSKYLLLMQ